MKVLCRLLCLVLLRWVHQILRQSCTIQKCGKRCGMIREIDWLGKKTGRLTGGGSMIPSVRKKSSLNQKNCPRLIFPFSERDQWGCKQEELVLSRKPNFVVMFLDDSGWADFRPFWETKYPTPNVERLAEGGCCYHQFYVPQAICSASRASLLTGCYPGRHKVYGAIPPRARGLDPSFLTIAQVLKPAGYTTGVFGKWHIGDHEETRPPAKGFDESSGLMYSNDMWKYHPQSRNFDKFELQFWKNDEIEIDDVTPEQQRNLTTWYAEHAVRFYWAKCWQSIFPVCTAQYAACAPLLQR